MELVCGRDREKGAGRNSSTHVMTYHMSPKASTDSECDELMWMLEYKEKNEIAVYCRVARCVIDVSK